MRSPKFTPWKIDARRFNECGMFYISNGYYIVAHALGQMSSCEDEAQAHARLIAAAPDLYALAQLVVDAYEDEDGCPNWKFVAHAAQMALVKARMPEPEKRP